LVADPHRKRPGSGVEIRQQLAHLDTFRTGKVTRIVTYTDRAEALEAVGLRG
jgi:ketosteroid isomerase-like protein